MTARRQLGCLIGFRLDLRSVFFLGCCTSSFGYAILAMSCWTTTVIWLAHFVSRSVTFVRKLSRTFHTWFLCVWYFMATLADTENRWPINRNRFWSHNTTHRHTHTKITPILVTCNSAFKSNYPLLAVTDPWSVFRFGCIARFTAQLQLVVVRHPCLLRLTVARIHQSTATCEKHQQSNSQSERHSDCDAASKDLALSLSLSHSRQPLLCLCVCFLFSLTFILRTHTHTLTEGGDRFVFVGFNGVVAVCWCACFVVGWQNNKNEECLQTNRSGFGWACAQK